MSGPAPAASWLAIVNPAAGGGRCGRRAPAVLERLRGELERAGGGLEVRASHGPGHATVIARAALEAGSRRFLAVGGDGTAFEVVNGLFPGAEGASPPPLLGFLPLGTGNSFVRDWDRDGLGYSLRALRENRSRVVDLLRLRHREGELWALGVVSLGFGATVAALVNRRLKRFGKAGYTLGVVAELIRLEPSVVRLGVDGAPVAEERMVLLCACNNRYIGGNMEMAPSAEVDDGRLDLVTVAPVGRLELIRTFPRIFAGTHVEHPAVRVRRGRVLVLELAGEVDAMVDGESLRLRLERVEVVPGALRVAL